MVRISSDTTKLALSVEETKEFLRVTSTDENQLIRAMSKSAEVLAETKTRRGLVQKQYEMVLDDFPGDTDAIELLYPPLSASAGDVVITYLDESSGDSTTLPATAYTIDYKSEPGRVYPSYDNEWPDVRDVRNAVTISYYSGYSTCPEPIKAWMKLRIANMYEQRQPTIDGRSISDLGRDYVDGLLDPYVLPEIY